LTTIEDPATNRRQRDDELWFTRCPVPTATGIAADQGWFDEEFGSDGISVRSLQDAASQGFNEHHFEHGISSLIREGGNVPAIWTRARGQATRLIGLTWIEESQAILVRADDDLSDPAQLAGRRLAIPQRLGISIDFWRAMALHGFAGALSIAGRSLRDAELIDVTSDGSDRGAVGGVRYSPELDALARGEVDAVYVKGAPGVDAATEAGARVAIDLDSYPDRRVRVNNGTPRPITVHQDLLDSHSDRVVRFLAVLLRAADWASEHPEDVARILSSETWAGADGVQGAYRGDFHRTIHPSLSEDRLELLTQQKDFLWQQGFLASDFEIGQWVESAPLEAARALLAEERAVRST
jgi:ABC-type nitrate/sulfonate/bicarbonate transport system substrate-binding protein